MSKQPSVKVSEGTRTPDRLDHNQELYQLSYAHQDWPESSIGSGGRHGLEGYSMTIGTC